MIFENKNIICYNWIKKKTHNYSNRYRKDILRNSKIMIKGQNGSVRTKLKKILK
jgi:hypothetical protein